MFFPTLGVPFAPLAFFAVQTFPRCLAEGRHAFMAEFFQRLTREVAGEL